MVISLRVKAHPKPLPEQFFLAKANGSSGSERSWKKQVDVQFRKFGHYDVNFTFYPQESGSFKIVYECDGKVDGKPVFSNSSDIFEVKVISKYRRDVL